MRFQLVLCLAILVIGNVARADVTITIQQVGSDVVASFSGTYDVNACSLVSASTSEAVRINTNSALIRFGAGSSSNNPGPSLTTNPYRLDYQRYDCSFTSAPTDYGQGQFGNLANRNYVASTGTGDRFGIINDTGFESVYIPTGVGKSGSLSGGIIFNDVTLNDLAVGIGTSTYQWVSNGTQTVTINAIPEPSAFTFFGLIGVVLAGAKFRNRHRATT